MSNDEGMISISSNNLDCKKVAEKLLELNILSSVIKNTSVIRRNDNYILENGCDIRLNRIEIDDIKDKIWKPLKKEFNLGCAHLEINGKYNGCINKYFKKY